MPTHAQHNEMHKLKETAHDLRSVGENRLVSIDTMSVDCWVIPGNENAVVFIHGNSSAKETFHEQFKYFADSGYTLLAIDLPGHGQSSNSTDPSHDYTGPAYARFLSKVLNKLSIKRPIILGWSLGGHIAIEMQGQGYEIQGIGLMGTPPVGPGDEFYSLAFHNSEYAYVTGTPDVSHEEITGYTTDLYGSLIPIPPLFYDFAKRTDGAARFHMYDHWLSKIDGYDQREVVKQSSVPTFVVQGLKDKFISAEYLRTIEWGNLWQRTIFEMDGVGHAPFIEAPERYNPLLEQFLEDIFAVKVAG